MRELTKIDNTGFYILLGAAGILLTVMVILLIKAMIENKSAKKHYSQYEDEHNASMKSGEETLKKIRYGRNNSGC